MSVSVDRIIRATVETFLRGDLSVVDFTYAFRAATAKVVEGRPLQGREVELFIALEEWESSGWADRADIVDRLRLLARQVVNDA